MTTTRTIEKVGKPFIIQRPLPFQELALCHSILGKKETYTAQWIVILEIKRNLTSNNLENFLEVELQQRRIRIKEG